MPRIEEEDNLDGVVGFHKDCTDSNHSGAAYTRREHTWCVTFRDRARGGTFEQPAHMQILAAS